MGRQQDKNVSEMPQKNNQSKVSTDTLKQPQQEVPAEETAQQKLFRQLQSIYWILTAAPRLSAGGSFTFLW